MCSLEEWSRLTFGWGKLTWSNLTTELSDLIPLFTVPKFAISQTEANTIVLISYDNFIKSLTRYPTISWSLSSQVILLYDKLQRGFANKQITRN